MDEDVGRRLIALNAEFYARFARQFARTRSPSLTPGIRRAFATTGEARSLLDAGCGDGRLLRAAREGRILGSLELYRGVDFAEAFLSIAGASGQVSPASGPPASVARARSSGARSPRDREIDVEFIRADLAEGGWVVNPQVAGRTFDAVACLAVLFHVPGAQRRLLLLERLGRFLAADGLLVISVWQFLHRDRFRRKVVPWTEIGMHEDQVDPGDLLIDWRSGGRGLRYVHHFEAAELTDLCERAGLEAVESFREDGETGDLSLFCLARRTALE